MPSSIRIKPSLKSLVERIANAERRPTNNWIVITLEDAAKKYLAEHPEFRREPGDEQYS